MWSWFLSSRFSLARVPAVSALILTNRQAMENGDAKQTSLTRLNTFTLLSALLASATSVLLGYGGSLNRLISFFPSFILLIRTSH